MVMPSTFIQIPYTIDILARVKFSVLTEILIIKFKRDVTLAIFDKFKKKKTLYLSGMYF